MSTQKLIYKKISILKKLIELYQKLLKKMTKRNVPVVIHHTATNRDHTSFESINRGHRRRKYPKSSLGRYCAYNVLITGDGNDHWARSLKEKGRGVQAFKEFHYDICLTGNFMKEEPSEEQMKTLIRVLKEIQESEGISTIEGHRDHWATLCPGKNLYKKLSDIRFKVKLTFTKGPN